MTETIFGALMDRVLQISYQFQSFCQKLDEAIDSTIITFEIFHKTSISFHWMEQKNRDKIQILDPNAFELVNRLRLT